MSTSLAHEVRTSLVLVLLGAGIAACGSLPGGELKELEQGASQGDADSQYQLGMAYLRGLGVEKNNELALEWLQSAARAEQPEAQYQLGEIYLKGQGVPREPAWAARWYGKAAEQGYAPAQLALARAFENGQGLPINWVRACQWALLAEQSGARQAAELQAAVCDQLTAPKHARAQQLAATWQPRAYSFYDDPPTIRYLQMKLQQLRFYAGYVDGVDGRQTRSAIEEYRADRGLTDSDQSLETLLGKLRAE